MELPELKVPDEEKCMAWKTQTLTEKTWKEHARLAWDLSPVLAVFLPSRLDFLVQNKTCYRKSLEVIKMAAYSLVGS